VPTALDVRDQWPDLFLDRAPRLARPLGRAALIPYYRMSGAAFRRATAVLGTSQEFVEWGLRRGGRRAGELDRDFPFGYAPPRTSASELEAARKFWRELGIGVDSNVPVVCFFGSLNHHFDFATVFDAARRLAGRQAVQWVLCGDGERLAEFRRQAVDIPGVVLPGWVNGPQIWALMERASFGLAPYVASANFLDNIANKPIEYLAGGLPILSSLGGGALDRLLSDHACGVSYAGDASRLADAVAASIARPADHLSQKQNARRMFAEKFEAARVYGDLADHLASLVAPRAERYDPRRAA
jgi:glycosyltransferase involved in cell wall biosynthesis